MIVLNGFQAILDGFDFTYIISLLLRVIPALLCLTVHELSHGLAAHVLGDDTAKSMGRLTLNPLKHLDPVGTLMLLVFRFGWAKPVMVNMHRFRKPKQGMALTALAGPASNVLLSVVLLFVYGLLYYPLRGSQVGAYVLLLIDLTAYMSLGLGLFNLIPVSPLDGSKVLFSVLPDRWYEMIMRYERYGSIVMILLLAGGVLGEPLSNLIESLYRMIFPLAQLANSWMIRLCGM